MFDELCIRVCTDNPNKLVAWFLMACFAYDKLDTPIISDACFDDMSRLMHQRYDSLEHMHKHLITPDRENFKGSSINIDWDQFPDRVAQATYHLLAKGSPPAPCQQLTMDL